MPFDLTTTNQSRESFSACMDPAQQFVSRTCMVTGIEFSQKFGGAKVNATEVEHKRDQGIKLVLLKGNRDQPVDGILYVRNIFAQKSLSLHFINNVSWSDAGCVSVADSPDTCGAWIGLQT
ncbi:hypothetical protein AYJ10_18765 [Serratia marcescens]|nr:hypothetical protein AYJ10_18765 [Serratia marcescens]